MFHLYLKFNHFYLCSLQVRRDFSFVKKNEFLNLKSKSGSSQVAQGGASAG